MKRRRLSLVAGFVFLAATAAPVVACLWDTDTLAMEREQFPGVLELITGKFLRHSAEFYRWRVRDRLEKIKRDPSDAKLYDDLAVAYEKLGDHEQAIDTILKKEAIAPGLYETYANLGTFYIHAGESARGIEQIDRAIEINPQAHFDREIYQKLIVNYVRSKRNGGRTPSPLDRASRYTERPVGFAAFVLEAQLPLDAARSLEQRLEKAIAGVTGMMHFGNHDSPVLLEALGDLLISSGNPADAKRLAARAYLKASYEVKDEAARSAYRRLAEESLAEQLNSSSDGSVKVAAMEPSFQSELTEAKEWYDAVQLNEKRWIEEGLNPEAEFARKYYSPPAIAFVGPEDVSRTKELQFRSRTEELRAELRRTAGATGEAGLLAMIVLVVFGAIFGLIIVSRGQKNVIASREQKNVPPPESSP